MGAISPHDVQKRCTKFVWDVEPEITSLNVGVL
jgi:hypothetical protein